MKHFVPAGQTDYTVTVFIPDSASTDGSGKTGLVAANLTVSYTRVETDNDVTVTDATSSLNNLAALTTAHTDWGLLEVSSTLAPGLYRLDIADAVFASGAWSAVVYVMVTTSAAAASPMEFSIGPVEANVTAIAANVITATSIAADAITDAKVASDVTIASVTGSVGSVTGAVGSVTGNVGGNVTGSVGSVAAGGITASSIATGAIDADAIATDAVTEIQSGLATAAALAVVDGIVDDILVDTAEIGAAGAGLTNINLPNQTMDIVGNITGNLSGSVGSVSGAVGSVASGGISAASFAAGAIDAAAIATNAIGSDELASSAITEIQSGLATASALATAQTSIDDLPTNAELATALGTADDAVLAQVALVKAKTDNLPSDPADQSLIIEATDALVTLINDVPTNAELATALAAADDAVLAAIAALNNMSVSGLLDAADAIEVGLTLRNALRLTVAASAGELSGAATSTVVIRNAVADSKDRITATVDADGNRSAVVVDLT